MSLDARYDQERKRCACGCGFFLLLTPTQVHQLVASETVMPLPAYVSTPADRERVDRLPVAECVQCRTRYDRLWREVV